MIRPRKHRYLRRPTRDRIRTPSRIRTSRQLATTVRESSRSRHTTTTRKSARHNTALTLGRAQCEAITSRCSGNSSAGTRCIPSTR
jgi:hypothetical protein